jgi:polysaccharide pyruvyl transferase WcaK-like protein
MSTILIIFEVIKVMKKSKLFINGGGNLIQDVTSTRSLSYYLGSIYLAKALGLKIMLYANGIGPVSS